MDQFPSSGERVWKHLHSCVRRKEPFSIIGPASGFLVEYCTCSDVLEDSATPASGGRNLVQIDIDANGRKKICRQYRHIPLILQVTTMQGERD